jgi:hypothetical protein
MAASSLLMLSDGVSRPVRGWYTTGVAVVVPMMVLFLSSSHKWDKVGNSFFFDLC